MSSTAVELLAVNLASLDLQHLPFSTKGIFIANFVGVGNIFPLSLKYPRCISISTDKVSLTISVTISNQITDKKKN
jgi:hypothetical protein